MSMLTQNIAGNQDPMRTIFEKEFFFHKASLILKQLEHETMYASTNFEMFEEVVHNVGKSDGEII